MHRQAQRFVSNGRTQTGDATVALITMPLLRANLANTSPLNARHSFELVLETNCASWK
jgi:hypothetical protein